jgi:hypothetical protein
VSGPPGGPFRVSGEHTYRRAGTYPLVIRAVDADGAQIVSSSNAIVHPAALISEGTFGSAAASGESFSGPLASFRDENPLSLPSDFSGVIDWGDGTETVGAVSGAPGGPYTVSGSHTYSSNEPFTVRVTIAGPEGASASAFTTLLFERAHLGLTATADPAGGDVPFDTVLRYVVHNDGPEPVWTVGVDSDVCGPAAFASGDDGNGVLDPGEAWTFTCAHRFDTAGTFTDTSFASANGLFDALDVRSDNVSTDVTADSPTTTTSTSTTSTTSTTTLPPPTTTATTAPPTTTTSTSSSTTSTTSTSTTTSSTLPPTTTSSIPPTPCKPGNGRGDKNHCHSGPPGLAERVGGSLIAATHAATSGAVYAFGVLAFGVLALGAFALGAFALVRSRRRLRERSRGV